MLAHRFLAQMLATCDAVAIRNGPEAVRLAERAIRLMPATDVSILDVLAAAYAEVGRFDDAVRTEQRAIELMTPERAGPLQSRLQHYRSGLPYRLPCGE